MPILSTTLNLAELHERALLQRVIRRYPCTIDTRCETCHDIVPTGATAVRRAGGWITCELCSPA